jgi:hypothetical protein
VLIRNNSRVIVIARFDPRSQGPETASDGKGVRHEPTANASPAMMEVNVEMPDRQPPVPAFETHRNEPANDASFNRDKAMFTHALLEVDCEPLVKSRRGMHWPQVH